MLSIDKSTKETQGKNRLEINKELKNRMNAKDVEYVFLMTKLREC